MIRKAFGILAGLLWLHGAAEAGRRPFLYAHDAATVPEGDAEIEIWLDHINQHAIPAPLNVDLWRFWFGRRFSPIDGVEIAALVSMQQSDPGGAAGFWGGLLESRWRSAPRPVGSLALELDLRVGMDPNLPHQIQPQLGWVRRGGRF